MYSTILILGILVIFTGMANLVFNLILLMQSNIFFERHLQYLVQKQYLKNLADFDERNILN